MTGLYAGAFVPAFIAIFAVSSLNQAKVCTPSGFARVGLLIGQTGDRVYLGEPQPVFRAPGFQPRIAVFPLSNVSSVFVGPTTRGGAECDTGRAMHAVLANAGAQSARDHAEKARRSSRQAAAATTDAAAAQAAREAADSALQAGGAALQAANELELLVPNDASRVADAARAATRAANDARMAVDNTAAGADGRAALVTAAEAAATAAAEADERLRAAVAQALRAAVLDSG